MTAEARAQKIRCPIDKKCGRDPKTCDPTVCPALRREPVMNFAGTSSDSAVMPRVEGLRVSVS